MKKINIQKFIPSSIRKFLVAVCSHARRSKREVFLVGGIVRDLLIKRGSCDYDIVVDRDGIDFATQLANRLGVSLITHPKFNTATIFLGHYKVDIATSRKEYYCRWGALPQVFPGNLQEDLARRDFTINAIAMSLNKNSFGQIVDFYGGVEDLRKGVVRVLHDKSFLEDPTRIFRAIRFEQRFRFKIETHSLTLLRKAVDLNILDFVSLYRIQEELVALLNEKQPWLAMRRLYQLVGFGFLDEQIVYSRELAYLMKRITKTIAHYHIYQQRYCSFARWVPHFMGLIVNLSHSRRASLLKKICFKKDIMRQLKSLETDIQRARRLLRRGGESTVIFNTLRPMSFETIVFLTAFFNDSRFQRKVKTFWDTLADIRLEIKGHDLKSLKGIPEKLYARIFEKVLLEKVNNPQMTKDEELRMAEKMFAKINLPTSHTL